LNNEELAFAEYDLMLDKARKGNINPTYYTDMKISPYEYITANELNWEQGNIVKYISRYKGKNGAEDIRKVIKYAEMLLEREYGSTKTEMEAATNLVNKMSKELK
jgi:hypothetical protein